MCLIFLDRFRASASLFFVFIIAFAIGCGIGWAIVCKKNIKVVNQQEGLLKMPGSWATLLIIMVIFITKYAFGFLMAVDAHVMHQAVPLFSMFAISAVLSGTLCGRLLNYVYRLRTTKKLKQDREYSKA